MESIEELLTCKVCMEKYNDKEKKPLFLPCGHTFCQKCLKFIYKRRILLCPLDKKLHKFDLFSKVPTNYSVLNTVPYAAGPSKRIEKKCLEHPKESLKLYC